MKVTVLAAVMLFAPALAEAKTRHETAAVATRKDVGVMKTRHDAVATRKDVGVMKTRHDAVATRKDVGVLKTRHETAVATRKDVGQNAPAKQKSARLNLNSSL